MALPPVDLVTVRGLHLWVRLRAAVRGFLESYNPDVAAQFELPICRLFWQAGVLKPTMSQIQTEYYDELLSRSAPELSGGWDLYN